MKPYAKAQTFKLEGLLDRRRRLTDKQKAAIREAYAGGNVSQRGLARKYGVSRSLIAIIVDPERAKSVADRFKANWRKYAMAKGKAGHARAVRSVRSYKYALFKKGVIGKSRRS